MYDLIIIGAGPAGLSAAIYASRARLNAIVIEQNYVNGGQIIIEDPEKRAAFQKAMGELGAMECEIKAEPVKVSLDRNPDITLGEIEALDGFVKFV